MTIKRDTPYIWITWLPKLLVGRDSCLWSIWYRANHQYYDKVPSTFDTAGWNIRHTALLDEVEKAYRQKYSIVQREAQNAFQYRGGSGAVLAGKPDLIGMRGSELRICDVKTGQRQDEHWAQMLLYMHFYPKCYPQLFSGLTITGELVYLDGKQEVYMDEFDGIFKSQVTKLLQAVSSESPPAKVPSVKDCSGCCITTEDCEDRCVISPENKQVELGDF